MKKYILSLIVFCMISLSYIENSYADASGNLSDAIVNSIINEPIAINWLNDMTLQESATVNNLPAPQKTVIIPQKEDSKEGDPAQPRY